MNENEEKFVIFTTDGNFHEFIPEAEAITAKEIFAEYLRLSEENKHINYLIMCPDGQIRTCAEVIERYIKPPKKMHEEIPGDTKIWKFDGVRAAAVYTGWLTRLEKGRENPGAGSNPAVCRKAALCFFIMIIPD